MVSRFDAGSASHQVSISVEKTGPNKDVSVVPVQTPIEKVELQSEQQLLPADKAKQLTDSMNTFLGSGNTQLRFQFHEKLNEYYVTIVDSETDEVVREIPSKKLMDIHAAIKEFVGLLVDRKI